MTRRRWIADEFQPTTSRAALTGGNADHLARVLRARPGQQFDIALPDGTVRLGTVASVESDRVEFSLGEELPAIAPTVNITLLLAIFKFDRFEWAVEKATELGATIIVPVIARRSDAHLVKAAEKRVERWTRVAREASQQSRRVEPPQISAPVKLKDALQTEAGLRLVLSEYEREAKLDALVREGGEGQSVALAVGPEGGWTEEELAAFAAAGWRAASLGASILRAETAAIAALAIARAASGD